jgi:hypothetical protein
MAVRFVLYSLLVGISSSQLLESEFLSEREVQQLQSRPDGVDPAFDCAARSLVFEYVNKLQGWRGATAMQQVHDSLELTTLCNQSAIDASTYRPVPEAPILPVANTTIIVEVDPSNGSDETGAVNAKASPFLSVHAAVMAVRQARKSSSQPCLKPLCPDATVVLRAGKHRIPKTLALDPRDNHLAFMNAPGEAAVFTGAQAIKPTWTPYKVRLQCVCVECGKTGRYTRTQD